MVEMTETAKLLNLAKKIASCSSMKLGEGLPQKTVLRWLGLLLKS